MPSCGGVGGGEKFLTNFNGKARSYVTVTQVKG